MKLNVPFMALTVGTAVADFAYVGSFTNEIFVMDYDPASGSMTQVSSVDTGASNPSWLALHPSGDYLYAVSEDWAPGPGSVAAFSVDKATGDLTLINRVTSGGNSPVHMEVDAEGKYAVVSLLGEGTVGLFPLLGSQGIGDALDSEGGVGPHQTILDERSDGTSAIVCDMRSNEVRVHQVDFYNSTSAELNAPLASLQLEAGAGPRHSVLGPNGDFVYIANENGNTVTVASYDASTGALSAVQTIDTLREEDSFNPPLDPNGAYPQQMAASSIVLDPSGGYIMASNRDLRDLGGGLGRDTIAVYRINPADGTLELTQHMWTGGQFPRHVGFDPSGRFLHSGNQLSNSIVAFSFDADTGLLAPTGKEAAVPAGPTHVLFGTN